MEGGRPGQKEVRVRKERWSGGRRGGWGRPRQKEAGGWRRPRGKEGERWRRVGEGERKEKGGG